MTLRKTNTLGFKQTIGTRWLKSFTGLKTITLCMGLVASTLLVSAGPAAAVGLIRDAEIEALKAEREGAEALRAVIVDTYRADNREQSERIEAMEAERDELASKIAQFVHHECGFVPTYNDPDGANAAEGK